MTTPTVLLSFVNGLGWEWAAVFFVATVIWITAFLHLARHGLTPGLKVLERHRPGIRGGDDGHTPLQIWQELQIHKIRIEGMQDLVEKSLTFFPIIGLLGTVVGFLKAMIFVAGGGLGTTDSLALLNGLLANGVSESLTTTVVGQALFFLFNVVYTAKSRLLTEVVGGLDDSMAYILSQLPRFEPDQPEHEPDTGD
jgi:hypothetical protein